MQSCATSAELGGSWRVSTISISRIGTMNQGRWAGAAAFGVRRACSRFFARVPKRRQAGRTPNASRTSLSLGEHHASWAVSGVPPTRLENPRTFMQNLVEDFLQHLRNERGQAENTQKTYAALLGKFVSWADGHGLTDW